MTSLPAIKQNKLTRYKIAAAKIIFERAIFFLKTKGNKKDKTGNIVFGFVFSKCYLVCINIEQQYEFGCALLVFFDQPRFVYNDIFPIESDSQGYFAGFNEGIF